MAFRYVAISPDGKHVSGALDVPSEAQAERALWDADYRVVSLRPARTLPSISKLFPSLTAVKKQALVTFARQLATLLESGVPVMRSLELLEDQAKSPALRAAMRGIAQSVRGGSTFADAVRQHPTVFPAMFARMVELGERTGHIEEMLRQVASYMEREDQIVRRVRGAMAYPAFVILLAIGVIGVLMTTALPTLVTLFDEFDGELPLATRLLINAVHFSETYRLHMLAGGVAVIAGGAWWLGKPSGKRVLDQIALTVPVIRELVLQTNAARFARTLALLLRAGLPLTDIMDMVVRGTDNSVLRHKVEDVQQRLLDGEGLSAPMAAAGCFPPMLVQMVAVGEETGTLDANLDITAEFYAREVDRRVDALTGMLTPAMTLVIGLIVGFIALSLIMPMYQLVGNIEQSGAGTPP